MQKRASSLLLALLGLFVSPGSPADDKEQAELRSMLAKLRENSDIRTSGMPGFQLTGKIRLSLQEKTYDGKYLLVWAPDGHWKEELAFPGYQRKRVGDANQFWQVRSTEIEFGPIQQLDQLVNIRKRLNIGTGASVKRSGKEKVGGAEADCLKIREEYPERTICFDASSLQLATYEGPSQKSDVAWRWGRAEFSRYQDWGGKSVPLSLRGFNDRKLVLDIQFDPPQGLSAIPADAFAVPQNATVWGNCDIEPWKLKEKQHPAYPMAARQEHRQGTVILYGVIEEDGSVSHLQVVASAGQDLDASSMAAVAHWKYDRSGCQEAKARQETFIDVIFSLHY